MEVRLSKYDGIRGTPPFHDSIRNRMTIDVGVNHSVCMVIKNGL